MASFSIPLSGLTAAQAQLQSVSNNLANMNTDGYKDQTVSFSDVFSQAGSTNGSGDPLQTGSGVRTASTDSNFTEGNLNATGTSSNMALSGNGFFVTQSASGLLDYTRAGDFKTNSNGQLITPNGELLLGYPASGGVVNKASAELQPLQVGGLTSPAVATTTFNIAANLNAGAAVGDAGSPSTFAVYDSLGAPHTLSVAYTKTATNSWDYTITVPSADLSTGGTGTTQVASGTLSFDSSGKLIMGTPATTSISVAIPPVTTPATTFASGALPLTLNWDLVDDSGNATITQTAAASATSGTTQDGYAAGTLSTYAVQPDGTIEGTFSSGKTLELGQVAVASFANMQGLLNVGNNNYQATFASGTAAIGTAGTDGRATIVGGSVEQSNVDIATEFAKLIVAQQAYSANAKSITTFNQVSQATLAMMQ
ncbi:MAG: flagellar hook protein FlgE [Acidobacteriaceae bacterium]|nr:flagellar hook protein FlgE [Acidobacteriaceae bacterium]